MGSLDGLFDLSGRVAVVTGGSRGLGREMALAFVERGADMVIASRKVDACLAVAAEVEQRGRRAVAVSYHAGRWDDAGRLYEEAYRKSGRCNVLVNNAGMSPLYSSVDAITEELYDKVMDVNLKGPFRLSALVGTRMAGPDHGGSDGGSIISRSSGSAASHRGRSRPTSPRPGTSTPSSARLGRAARSGAAGSHTRSSGRRSIWRAMPRRTPPAP